MLIINADDFGKDSPVNAGIIRAFKRGLASSATLTPNMPAFDEACRLSHEHNLINRIGLHLALDGCRPLTEKIRRLPRLCNSEGLLCLGRLSAFGRSILILETPEKRAVAEEVRAQIKRCRAYKIPLTHVDSHHHIHTAWPVATILMHIAREEGIRHIRISRNIGPNINVFKRIYKYIFNKRLKMANFARTEYFGLIEDLIFLQERMDISRIIKSCEIMVHPRLNDNGVLIDETAHKELEQLAFRAGIRYDK